MLKEKEHCDRFDGAGTQNRFAIVLIESFPLGGYDVGYLLQHSTGMPSGAK